jgi:fructokinase
LEVGLPYLLGQDPIPRLCDTFIESPKLQQRTGTYLARQLHEYIWSWAPRLANLNEDRRLVHSDFGSRNILVKCVNDRWMVAAVLDWEFAFSGSPLLDVGHFLRYEKKQLPLREPWFSSGFVEGGGSLCDDWRELARAVDLTGLCASLAEPALPDDVTIEILGLIRATLEARDPD